MPKLIRDGFILNYRQEGQGPPVLVIGSAQYYAKTFSQNLRERFKLIFTDHRGFAQATESNHSSEDILDKIVEDLEALRVHLKFQKIIVLGHSGHAHMAVAYAKKYPAHVVHLILVGISPLENPAAANQYFEAFASDERKSLLARNLAQMENSFVGRMLCFGPMLWSQYDYDASDLWSGIPVNEVIANDLWGRIFKQHDLSDDFDSLLMPIDIILGKWDFFNPPHLWDEVKLHFPKIGIHILEKAGHTPQLEDPEGFDRLFLSVVQKKSI